MSWEQFPTLMAPITGADPTYMWTVVVRKLQNQHLLYRVYNLNYLFDYTEFVFILAGEVTGEVTLIFSPLEVDPPNGHCLLKIHNNRWLSISIYCVLLTV